MTNNLVIIDDTIVDHSVIIESLNTHTSYIILNGLTDTYDALKIKITNLNILAFNSIGIIQHNRNEPTYCLFRNINIHRADSTIQNNDENTTNSRRIINYDEHVVATDTYTRPPMPVSILSNVYEKDPDLESWTDYINFIAFLKTTYLMQNFDIMACAVYSDANWKYVIDLLKIKTGLNIRASLDNTGSSNLGGNWFLETGNINLKDIYFTENINKFNGLLNTVNGFTGDFAPQWWNSGGSGTTLGSGYAYFPNPQDPGYYANDTATELLMASPNEWRDDGGFIYSMPFFMLLALGVNPNNYITGRATDGRGRAIKKMFITPYVAGTIRFDYAGNTSDNSGWDSGWSADPFGIIINGVKYRISNGGSTIYGSYVLQIDANVEFGFYIESRDQLCGSSYVTFSNFSFTPTIIMETPTLVTSKSTIYQNFVSGAIVSFDFISSNAGSSVSRIHESNNPLIVTVDTASTPFASIVAPGKTTIKVTQYQTTNYTEVVNNDLITIVIIGQDQIYASEIFSSIDLSGANLSGSTFSNCTLIATNLFGTTVNSSTDFTSSTFIGITSGNIIGTTDLLPPGYKMI